MVEGNPHTAREKKLMIRTVLSWKSLPTNRNLHKGMIYSDWEYGGFGEIDMPFGSGSAVT
jgi:hypothetical protein